MSRALKISSIPIVVALVVAIAFLPVAHWLGEFVEWDRHLGVEGLVIYSVTFVVLGLSLIPTMPLYIGAGLLYGTWWGAVMTTLLGVVIELAALVLLRTNVRPWVEARLGHHDRLAALHRAVERDGFWILFLLRLSPLVPFGLLNYALALARVPLWRRVLTNVLGMFPCCVMFAYLGTLISGAARIATAQPPSPWKYIAITAGLAAVFGAALLGARATREESP